MPDVDSTWTVGVLPDGVENVQTLAEGAEATVADAMGAATAALVDAAQVLGRQEFRVEVAGRHVVVLPGLNDGGAADVAVLRQSLAHLDAGPR
jgi:hypothetical protein